LEVGPDLLRTISVSPPDRKPIALCQGDGLTRFNLRSKSRQGNYSSPQETEYCQSGQRFDHLSLLT